MSPRDEDRGCRLLTDGNPVRSSGIVRQRIEGGRVLGVEVRRLGGKQRDEHVMCRRGDGGVGRRRTGHERLARVAFEWLTFDGVHGVVDRQVHHREPDERARR